MRTRIIFLIIALLLTNAFTFAQTGKSGYGFSIDIGYDMNANKNNSERLEISTTARKYVTSLAKCLRVSSHGYIHNYNHCDSAGCSFLHHPLFNNDRG